MRPRVGSRVQTGHDRRVYTAVDVAGTLRTLCASEDGSFLGLLDNHHMRSAEHPCSGCGGVGAHKSGDCAKFPTRGHAYKAMAIRRSNRPEDEPNCRICDRPRDNGVHFEIREVVR